MQKKHAFASLLVAVIASSSWLFSTFLVSRDTTLGGYLSGMMLGVVGGEESKLMRVNLYNGTLDLYENGNHVRHDRIAGSGNPKNSTATPVGNFRVLSKEPRHISSLSGVIMPWSLRFHQGYYFHAIPLTPQGAQITTRYSHGCIRLPNALAPEIYQWANIGTYVEVYRSRLVRGSDAPTVFLLTEDGVRKPIVTLEAFERNKFSWAEVVVVPSAELSQLPLGVSIE